MTTQKKEIAARRCIHVKNIRSTDDPFSDLTVIKERIRYTDGTEEPRVSYKKNIQRPFWVEKKKNQNYKDKKETRPKSEMDEYWCTQSELPYKVKKVLGNTDYRASIRKLARSPYVYGLDHNVDVMVKRELDRRHEAKYGAYTPDVTMAVLDYETDMESGLDFVVEMGSVTMGDIWYCVVDRHFFEKKGIYDYEERMGEYLDKYLGTYMKDRKVCKDKVMVFVDSEIEVIKALYKKLHELQPDVVSVWNVEFEVDRTIEACNRAGVNPVEVFCDGRLPPEFQTYSWVKDEGNKLKAGGKSSTKDICDKWHKFTAPNSWHFIDNMCLYRTLRAVEQKLPGYRLDDVLKHVFKGKVKKMKFDKLHDVPANTPQWHTIMQKEYPFEYVCYNIFDCVAMELLDEKEKDVAKKLLSYAGITNWLRIKSNPTRLADAYHVYLAEQFDRVLCSTSDRMKHMFDKYTLPPSGWVVTLSNTLQHTKGIGLNPFIKDKDGNNIYDYPTKIYKLVYDVDVSSAYPSDELALNVSRDTTMVEVCAVDGLTLKQHMSVAVNLTQADGNGSKISREVFGLPSSDELLAEFNSLSDEDLEQYRHAA